MKIRQIIVFVKRSSSPLAEMTCWNVRDTLALLGCLGMTVMYAVRVNLSVAIIAMAGKDDISTTNTTNTSMEACPRPIDGPINQTTLMTLNNVSL